jgi:hypothetical protein
VRIDEVHEVQDAPIRGLFGRAAHHRRTGIVGAACERVHRGGVADLPADVERVFDVGRVNRQSMVVVVHAQVERVVVARGRDLLAEQVGGVAAPGIGITRPDPQVAESVDLCHAARLSPPSGAAWQIGRLKSRG